MYFVQMSLSERLFLDTIYKYVLNKENVGLSKAANKAIELVDTPFVLNLQADCEITNPDIDKLHQALKKYDNSFLVSPTFYSDNKLTFNSTPLPEKQIDQKVLKIEGDVCVFSITFAASATLI